MAKITPPIPQDKIGESFVWRDWFQRLSDKVFGTISSQDSSNVSITGGTITGLTSPLPIASGGTNTTAVPTAGTVAYGTGTAYAFTSVGTTGQILSSNGAGAPTWSTAGSGSVTSVAASVPSFLSITGSPITTSGTLAITYSGTALPVANGGTGATIAATARSNLSAAQSGTNTDITSVTLTTGTISTAPSSSTDIVNKSYADSISTGINFHSACNYATTVALSAAYTYNNGTSGVGATITANAVGTLTIDGYTFVSGDVGKRILIKNEPNAYVNNTTPSAAFNGVYTLTTAGTAGVAYVLTRATDYDSSGSGTNEVDQGDLLLVLSGTTNANTSWVQQTPLPITVGTTSLVFIQFAAVQTYTAGTGLTLSTNQFSITNAGTAGTYGSASSIPVIITNAQGQITGVTPTSVAIAGSAVTGNISGNAANVTGTVAVANGGTGLTTTPVNGALDIGNGTGFTRTTLTAGTNVSITNTSGAITINSSNPGGTVTSVGLALPSIMLVSGSPVTSSGTLTGTLTTQSVNTLFAGPSSGAGATPTFRALVTADIPSLSYVSSVGTTAPITSSGGLTPTIGVTAAALNKVDDTNVTMTLSGSPSTALIAATTMGLGWTGQLAVSRGGTGVATTTSNFVFIGPTSGSPAAPSFRALTTTDIPSLAYVTSVSLSLPSILTVSGSPVTSSGTLTGTLTTQAVNTIFAGPSSGAGVAPTFRSLTTADIPTLNQNTTGTAANITATSNSTLTTLSALSLPGSQVSGNISGNAANVTGTVAIGNGGTGQSTAAAAFNALAPVTTTGDLIIGNGTNSSTRLAIGANNYVLTSNGTTASWAASSGSGATISNDTSTSTNLYPLFANATSGAVATVYTGNANYLYKPSTGELTAVAHVSSNGIQINATTVGTSYTIATGNNGLSAGPVSVSTGITVTISTGSVWTVV